MPTTIFGAPVLIREALPGLGTEGDVALIDSTQYVIGARKELAVERSEHYGFLSDMTYYRCLWRGDGQPIWSGAITPMGGGTTTLGAAVVLTTP